MSNFSAAYVDEMLRSELSNEDVVCSNKVSFKSIKVSVNKNERYFLLYDSLKALGIVLTGGGSQLRHLIQLTEYVTGMPARIGLPNEHLAAGHIEELAKPTYSTCLGLILKGCDDYENNRKVFEKSFISVEVPEGLKDDKTEVEDALTGSLEQEETQVVAKPKKTLNDGFWRKFKDGLIKIFAEEGDEQLH